MAKVGRPIKFGIRLTPEERTRLEGMIHCGKGPINSALKARILLKADVSENGPGWSDERIADALETSLSTVFRTRRQFVEEGLDAALSRKKSSWSPPWIFDEEAEAKLIALACSEPPQGYTHWTMQMLEKRVVELGIVEKTSDTTIFRALRRNEVKPQKKYWVIPPKAVSDFVAAMEETLKIYTRSHDPARPLVCLDEASRQLTRETHKPLLQPATRGAERLPLSYIQQLESDTGRPRLVLSRYFNSFEVSCSTDAPHQTGEQF